MLASAMANLRLEENDAAASTSDNQALMFFAHWTRIRYTKQLSLPVITEDTSKPTLIRISFAFIKSILLLLDVEAGYEIAVHHFDQGIQVVSRVKIELTVPRCPFNWWTCMDLSQHDWFFLMTVDPDWRMYMVALTVFARRGERRIEKGLLSSIIYTAVACKILSKEETNPYEVFLNPKKRSHLQSLLSLITNVEKREFAVKILEMPEQRAPFNCGAFQAFEITLMLTRQLFGIMNSESLPAQKLGDFFNLSIALKLSRQGLGELQLFTSKRSYYDFTKEVIQICTAASLFQNNARRSKNRQSGSQ